MSETERKSRRSVYGELESMAHLESQMPGFDMRDEYLAMWRLVEELGIGLEEARREMEKRVVANLWTYGVERDTVRFEGEYVWKQAGRRVKLSTSDHDNFGCLTEMSLLGAKKVREEGGDFLRETAVVIGVRRLKQQLSRMGNGEQLVLLYPPLEGGETSILYSYQVLEEGGEKRIKVDGAVVGLSLEGVSRLHRRLWGGSCGEERPHDFVASPLPWGGEFGELCNTALEVLKEDGCNTGIDLSVKFSGEEVVEYAPQVMESGKFLNGVLWEEYERLGGVSLGEYELEKLELAFSFARRAVLNFHNRGQVVSAEELLRDYEWRLSLEEAISVPEQVLMAYEARVGHIYGDLSRRLESAGGCPPAMLAALGFSSNFNNFGEVRVGDPFESGECVQKKCRVCGNTKIEETDTCCSACGWVPGTDPIRHKQQIEEKQQRIQEHMRKQVETEGLPKLLVGTTKRKEKNKNPDGKDKEEGQGLWMSIFG